MVIVTYFHFSLQHCSQKNKVQGDLLRDLELDLTEDGDRRGDFETGLDLDLDLDTDLDLETDREGVLETNLTGDLDDDLDLDLEGDLDLKDFVDITEDGLDFVTEESRLCLLAELELSKELDLDLLPFSSHFFCLSASNFLIC